MITQYVVGMQDEHSRAKTAEHAFIPSYMNLISVGFCFYWCNPDERDPSASGNSNWWVERDEFREFRRGEESSAGSVLSCRRLIA